MSAAATAAGYLYASGRLRGRAKDGEETAKPESPSASKRRPLRIAAIRELEPVEAPRPASRPRPAVKIEYRTRRWRPGGE
jgi:hypothetical protein